MGRTRRINWKTSGSDWDSRGINISDEDRNTISTKARNRRVRRHLDEEFLHED